MTKEPMMIDLTTATGEQLAMGLSDIQFETLVRSRVGYQLDRLVGSGAEHHSGVYMFAGKVYGKLQWQVQGGRDYTSKFEAKGEVLSAVVDVVLEHQRGLGRCGLAQLGAAGTALLIEATATQADDEIPF
jgi:hypothetical protein